MSSGRSKRERRIVANPLLGLPAAAKLQALPPESRAALREVLLELGEQSKAKSEACWRNHKGLIAAYWKAVGVYCRHFARLLK